MKGVTMDKRRVVVAMSGGVDSSVAACLLHEQGYQVVGMGIRSWPTEFCNEESKKSCYSPEDARAVASQLGIPFYLLNFEELFREKVIDYFISEYTCGRTPNPCVPCNDHIRFGALLRRMRGMGYDFVATGHYARVGYDSEKNQYLLREARDSKKDQSYVLFGLTQEKLRQILFPIGEMTKEEVRSEARRFGLRVADKAESQDACFLHEKDYRSYLSEQGIESKEGEIVDEEGRILGRHPGIHAFTVGQRNGLGVPAGKPIYVTAIDVKQNRLIVGPREALARRQMWVDQVRWISEELAEGESKKLSIKIRYRNPKAPAWVGRVDDSCQITFEEPAYAVTPGQACVFYDDDLILGGGWIR